MASNNLLKLTVILALVGSVGETVAQNDVTMGTRQSQLRALAESLQVRDEEDRHVALPLLVLPHRAGLIVTPHEAPDASRAR